MISPDMTKTPLLFATRKVKSHRKTLSFITAKNGIEGHSPEVISCLRRWNWPPFFISISLLFLYCYYPFYFLSCNVFFPFLNIVMKCKLQQKPNNNNNNNNNNNKVWLSVSECEPAITKRKLTFEPKLFIRIVLTKG